jgi:hypothetical protein
LVEDEVRGGFFTGGTRAQLGLCLGRVRTKASNWSGVLGLQLGRGEMNERKTGWAGFNKNLNFWPKANISYRNVFIFNIFMKANQLQFNLNL